MVKSVAVLVTLATDDPRLDPDKLNVSTVKAVSELRRAVIDNLPNLQRVVLVTHEEHAQMMCVAHNIVAEQIGRPNFRPPPEYVPPTRD